MERPPATDLGGPDDPLTRFVLRHKALVALFWVAVAAAGVITISGTTHRMTNTFAMPGQAFNVDNQIARQYGNGGSQTPLCAGYHRAGRAADNEPNGYAQLTALAARGPSGAGRWKDATARAGPWPKGRTFRYPATKIFTRRLLVIPPAGLRPA